MKILPASTSPPTYRIRRHHSPAHKEGRFGYRSYRACLRWEFAFSCSFCLIHETDLAPPGVEGLGVIGTEHYELVSEKPELANSYENCFYACKLCNDSRSTAPVATRTRRLLNPCDDNWSRHFSAEGDRLRPRAGDVDAEYTHEVYDLDDPRKVRMREMRRKTIDEFRTLVEDSYQLIEALLARGLEQRDPLSLAAAEELRKCVQLTVKDILRYRAIPEDAPTSCRCHNEDEIVLPAWLDAQLQEP